MRIGVLKNYRNSIKAVPRVFRTEKAAAMKVASLFRRGFCADYFDDFGDGKYVVLYLYHRHLAPGKWTKTGVNAKGCVGK